MIITAMRKQNRQRIISTAQYLCDQFDNRGCYEENLRGMGGEEVGWGAGKAECGGHGADPC